MGLALVYGELVLREENADNACTLVDPDLDLSTYCPCTFSNGTSVCSTCEFVNSESGQSVCTENASSPARDAVALPDGVAAGEAGDAAAPADDVVSDAAVPAKDVVGDAEGGSGDNPCGNWDPDTYCTCMLDNGDRLCVSCEYKNTNTGKKWCVGTEDEDSTAKSAVFA